MNDITELAQRMKAAAEKASNGAWVKESGDGWEASCSANDQANGGFIIAQFEGPDAAANREFVQAANPANVMALVEALEARDKQIVELEREKVALESVAQAMRDDMRESRTVTVKLPKAISVLHRRDFIDAHRAIYAYPEAELNAALAAAGIQVIEGDE